MSLNFWQECICSKEARPGIRNYVSSLTSIDDASCEQTWLVHEICSWSHCLRKWTSCGRLQSHPPIQVPLVLVPDQPLALELGVDRKVVVGFRTRLWKSSSLWSKFLCHRPDVVRLKSTTASYVADSQVESLSSPLPCFPSGDLSWLHGERELWERWRPPRRSLRHPPSNRLCHQIGRIQARLFQGCLHPRHHS